MTRSLIRFRSTRNAPFGTGRHGGWGPLFARRGEVGGRYEKFRMGGTGASNNPEGRGGTPTPSCDHPTPLVRDRRGGPPSPSRLTLHAKYTFWDWNGGGVVPCFARNRGGGGLSMKKENRGEGGGSNSGGHPPARRFWGRGGGLCGAIFFRIAGSGPEVFKKSSFAGLWFFENPEQRDYAFWKILSDPITVFLKSLVTPSRFLKNPRLRARAFFVKSRRFQPSSAGGL